jgi:hypothetical protein
MKLISGYSKITSELIVEHQLSDTMYDQAKEIIGVKDDFVDYRISARSVKKLGLPVDEKLDYILEQRS